MLFGRSKRAVKSILIVEDEPLVAFDNEYFLTQAGYTIVSTVDNYEDATQLIGTEPIDLVIADVKLSGERNGVDVARHANEKGVGVMFVTGHCPLDARHLAIGCLAKPYSQRELLASIEAADAVIRGRRPRKVPRSLTLFTPS